MVNNEYKEKKEFVEELKRQWKLLWWNRIDDKVKAEGIASQDFSMLFVESGTVITATRDYKPLDFVQILAKHDLVHLENVVSPRPAVGGYGKFAREVFGKKQVSALRRQILEEAPRRSGPRKKGGRGWLHVRL